MTTIKSKDKEYLLYIANEIQENRNKINEIGKRIDKLIEKISLKVDAQRIEEIKNKHNLK